MKRFSILLLLTTLSACTASKGATQTEAAVTNQTTPAADDASGDVTAVDAANAAFLNAYESGDATGASAHYAQTGVWYLTNGAAISGRESIEAFLAKAHADGAGAFEFSNRTVTPVGEHRYTTEQFAFDLAPGTTVQGTRYALWSETDAGITLQQDAWVPNTKASTELTAAIEQRTGDLAKAYNGGDAAALRAFYEPRGTMVLSSGAVIGPDAIAGMLDDTAKMGISDMRFGPQKIFAAGEAAYAIGDFDVTLPMPDGDIPLSGTRLMLWRKNGDVWQVALELSWPRAKKTASVEAGGMKFEWRFEGGKLLGTMRAPTTGWVAVGFNDDETLAGSRLIMARVVNGEVVAEEHIAQPPNHHDIRTLGAPQTLSELRGRANGEVEIDFALDAGAVQPSGLELRPGQRVWLTLAFSDDPDFGHHSRFRTAQRVRL